MFTWLDAAEPMPDAQFLISGQIVAARTIILSYNIGLLNNNTDY
jgi:hypothetical protein